MSRIYWHLSLPNLVLSCVSCSFPPVRLSAYQRPTFSRLMDGVTHQIFDLHLSHVKETLYLPTTYVLQRSFLNLSQPKWLDRGSLVEKSHQQEAFDAVCRIF
ncbi:hypothetical protein F4775DRAFT_575321 [Biscogniauxia sp. FL1348]|nr:hypothetical protein F4775DRAFT_575321 [Biscogniauxia sp. FL1348]